MGIVDEDVAKVRDAADFVALASQHVALKKVGRQWVGLCPFHAEKSPSFSINAEKGVWWCFGCSRGGDVISFLREVEHLDFVGAVERLAASTGITLRYDDKTEGRDRQRRGVLIEAMEKAVDWYHERLLSSPDAGQARSYLRERGYDGEVVRQFKLGWSPDDWDALAKGLSLPEDVLSDTGLGFKNKAGRLQDAFRGRVMFPIFDVSGDPVAFGGRRLADGEGPKYKNSPETPIYHKRRTLYGLNWAKAGIVSGGEVVVCEGYTDVIGLFRSGVPRAVATCGTALADEHFRVMKNFARRVVLAYDADAAGQAAAERFYEWEKQFEVDITVLSLPQGSDPGDMARRDPDGLAKAVAEAKPFLAFRLTRILDAANLDTPEGRARAAEASLVVIAEHPSDLVRDQYLQQIEMRTRISVDRLRERLRQGPRRAPRPTGSGDRPTQAQRRKAPTVESHAIQVLIHHRDELTMPMAEVLFSDELHAGAYRALEATASVHEAISQADPAVAELIQRLAVGEIEADPNDVIADLVGHVARRALREVEADAAASDDPLSFSELLAWLKRTSEQLADPDSRQEAVGWLVAWLVERAQEPG